MNFSIPDSVKELFNSAFAGKNRSAVVTELMRKAAEHEMRLRRRREAVADVLQERLSTPPVASAQLLESLRENRR